MSRWSSVVQVIGGAGQWGSLVLQVIGGAGHRVIGGAGHRGNRGYRSPGVNGGAGRRGSTVVHVTRVIDDTCYKRSSAVHHDSYYIHLFALLLFLVCI